MTRPKKPSAAVRAAWNTRIDFVGPMTWTLAMALAACLGSLLLLATRGLSFGTDFAGGYELQVQFDRPVAEAQLRQAIAEAGLQVAQVQVGQRSDRPEYTVRLAGVAERVGQALVAGLGGNSSAAIIKRVDFVGPQVGKQLRWQGLFAVGWALFFIFLYVAVRFDMLFSPGAILATLHDIIITMGVLSALQVEFSLNVVAALLTLIGFSLNDTIVVYDRIRENVAQRPGLSLAVQVNNSINETLSRTVLTSGTVVLVTLALLLLGGPFLFGLALTMLVGVVVGTYSSIAVAAPLYMLLRRRFAGDTAGGAQIVARA